MDVDTLSCRICFTPYPPHYKTAFASSILLHPHILSAHLAARFPTSARQEGTGFPRST